MAILKKRLVWHAPRRRPAHASPGFTAVELMTVIAIVAILAALAQPSFKYLIERWRVRDAVEAMTSTLYLARSEAIKRGGHVFVEQGTSLGGTCATGDWSCGWTIHDGTALIRSYAAPASLNVIGTQAKLEFDRWGDLDGAAGTMAQFTIYPSSADAASPATTTLCMSSGGWIQARSNPSGGDATCS